MPYRFNPFTNNFDFINANAGGGNYQQSASVGTTVNLLSVYDNGVAGEGATLTNSGALIALTIDGELLILESRVLVKDQTAQLQNGIYTVTIVGDGSTAWELTRAFNYDTPEAINPGDVVPVVDGTVNGDTLWNQKEEVLIVGTDIIVFEPFTGGGAVTSVSGTTDFTTSTGGTTPVIDIDTKFKTTGMHGWNGSILETVDGNVTSDGATITYSVEKSGGGNLTVVFSDGYYAWTTAPDIVTLTAGSDPFPQMNYVYFLQSTKTLTVSTVGWPATEHAPLATVFCQSATSLQTKLAMKDHSWTDHVVGSDDQGHVGDVSFWIRQQAASYVSGVTQTYGINAGPSPNEVTIATVSGVVLQLHEHAYPAFAAADDYYVVNDSVTPNLVINDLNAIDADSTGATLIGRFYSVICWGVISQDTGECKRFLNLPRGSYNNSAGVEADLDGFANYTIPNDYVGTGFLISEWKLRNQGGTVFTSIEEIDLRGLLPSLTAGGGAGVSTEFPDNTFRIFDDVDDTKKIAFQASPITTGNTRIVTMLDADIDLADVVQSSAALTDFAVMCGDGGVKGSQSVAALGGVGEVLTSNGPGVLPTFQPASGGDGGGGKWVLIETQTASASSTIDFTTSINSTYDNYVFLVSSIICSVDAHPIYLRTSTNAGSTWDQGASDYKYGSSYFGHSGSATVTASSVSDRIFLTGSGLGNGDLGNQSGENYNATIYLYGPSQTKKVVVGVSGSYLNDANEPIRYSSMGFRDVVADVDGVRFFPNSGTFTSGTISLYGISKEAGGGGGEYDVSNFSGGKMYISDEFMDNGTDHSLGWSVSTANGGGTGTKSLSGHYGVVKLTRGTTANGSAMLRLPNAFYPNLPFKFGFYMQIPTLSDGTDRFDVEMGVSNSTTSSGAITDGLYLRYVDDENSGKWLVVTEKDGTPTSSDSGITATTDWTYFEIQADASWTNISFYINGVETSNSPSTTNIPATTDFMYFFFRVMGTDGTTDREIYYDRFYMITNP